MQLFSKVLMASEDVKSYLVSGRYYSSSAPASIFDGAVVVVGDLEDHEVYDGLKDINVRKITSPTAVTDRIAFVDYVGVSEVEVMNVLYRVGDKTAGLTAPAGAVVRVRVPQVGDTFWLGADNFASTPTVGQYAETTANASTLTPAASIGGDGGSYVKVEFSQEIITGNVNAGLKYFCTVAALA